MISSIGSSQYSMRPSAPMRQSMFKKADANEDGVVTKDEMAAVAPKDGKGPSVDDIFSKIDENQDGVIDEAEDTKAQEQMRKNGPPGGPPDTEKMAADLFKKADTDEDGSITQEELSKILSKDGDDSGVEELFKSADEDGNGSITQAELQKTLQKVFEEMQSQSQGFNPDDTGGSTYSITGAKNTSGGSSFSTLA